MESKPEPVKPPDEWWDAFVHNYEANRCPWCDGNGRVGLYACNACGATGQRPKAP
jgi:hypothetical protein